ncbi:hypothetical protein CYLTODRAFT_330843, partial [Cylindrobasidium torrendii FP15055 ss-10]
AYDVWCQYVKNLRKRIIPDKLPDIPADDKFWGLLDRVQGGIPSLHVEGHVPDCKAVYSFAHLKHTGLTPTENVETPWVETKKLGGSIKHENHGARQDSLDTNFAYWNYLK